MSELDHDPRLAHIDRDAFARDIEALRSEVMASLSVDDYRHFQKLLRWSRGLEALGLATAWVAPNPVSVLALSTASVTRWAVIAHHTLHGGLDKVPGVPPEAQSEGFAKGRRRLIDWLDWMHPSHWAYEHNVLHHHRTGERADPDLVEENVAALNDKARGVRALALAFYMLTWKVSYYAPNTFQIAARAAARRADRGAKVSDPAAHDARGEATFLSVFDPRSAEGRAFWRACLLPNLGLRYGLIPLAMGLVTGPWGAFSALSNTAMAELVANLHSFCVIAPNHAGGDLYRFATPVKGRKDFYLRQVLSSVNFRTGGDLNDFLHGFLNYQIEHHLFSDLPPSAYQRIAPRVKAICEKHGVPYVQESVFARVKRLAQIWMGDAKMLRPDDAAETLHTGQ